MAMDHTEGEDWNRTPHNGTQASHMECHRSYSQLLYLFSQGKVEGNGGPCKKLWVLAERIRCAS